MAHKSHRNIAIIYTILMENVENNGAFKIAVR